MIQQQLMLKLELQCLLLELSCCCLCSLSGLEQCILEFSPLLDFHENTVSGFTSISLVTHCVAEHAHTLPVLRAQQQKDFLRTSVKLYQRKEMGLIKDSAPYRQQCLDMFVSERGLIVAQPVTKRAVDVADLPIICKRDESAGCSIEKICSHLSQIFLDERDSFIGIAHMRAVTCSLHDFERGAWKLFLQVLSNSVRRDHVVRALKYQRRN